MSDISREELIAFSEAHAKLSVALSKITDVVEAITQKQDKIMDKMTNGVTETIIGGVTGNYNLVHKETVSSLIRVEAGIKEMSDCANNKIPKIIEEKLYNSDMAKDIKHTKWFVAVIGIVTIVCIVILRFIGQTSTNNTVERQTEVIQHMLQQHIESTENQKVH